MIDFVRFFVGAGEGTFPRNVDVMEAKNHDITLSTKPGVFN
jgi:hypothetical protein